MVGLKDKFILRKTRKNNLKVIQRVRQELEAAYKHKMELEEVFAQYNSIGEIDTQLHKEYLQTLDEYKRLNTSFYTLIKYPDVDQLRTDLAWKKQIPKIYVHYRQNSPTKLGKEFKVFYYDMKEHQGYTHDEKRAYQKSRILIEAVKDKNEEPLSTHTHYTVQKVFKNREELEQFIPPFLEMVNSQTDDFKYALSTVKEIILQTQYVIQQMLAQIEAHYQTEKLQTDELKDLDDSMNNYVKLKSQI